MGRLSIFSSALAIAICLTSPSAACGVYTGERTFLEHLPTKAKHSQFVAFVEISELTTEPSCFSGERLCLAEVVYVKVINPLKSAKSDQRVRVAHVKNSCTVDENIRVGEQYFIAGEIIDGTVWSGPAGAQGWDRTWQPPWD
ncbi:hypothetical protein [Ruegeria sp. A3M17]|uniref:hypothetical protein n=1 Tax=Ruegeria sp. A3M17 TaxID=2267229 RepID=UPI0011BF9E86|nr:hypothetical protein [Ruegeria sp. A3M17]